MQTALIYQLSYELCAELLTPTWLVCADMCLGRIMGDDYNCTGDVLSLVE